MNQSFPDPSKFKDEKEFTYAALAASTFKKAVAEIVGWIESQKQIAKTLKKKSESEDDKSFEIGR